MPETYLVELLQRYPELQVCSSQIRKAYELMRDCYINGGKVLLCGNGGSCADCDHILGELMKSFKKKRKIHAELAQKFKEFGGEQGSLLSEKLEAALPAVNLCSNSSLMTAIANDTDADMIFSQQVAGYAKPGDVLIGISPKGSAVNIINAIITAKVFRMNVIGFVSQIRGDMGSMCDVAIHVPETEVFKAQEYHLPIYHTLCLMLEEYFYNGE